MTVAGGRRGRPGTKGTQVEGWRTGIWGADEVTWQWCKSSFCYSLSVESVMWMCSFFTPFGFTSFLLLSMYTVHQAYFSLAYYSSVRNIYFLPDTLFYVPHLHYIFAPPHRVWGRATSTGSLLWSRTPRASIVTLPCHPRPPTTHTSLMRTILQGGEYLLPCISLYITPNIYIFGFVVSFSRIPNRTFFFLLCTAPWSASWTAARLRTRLGGSTPRTFTRRWRCWRRARQTPRRSPR